MIVLDASTMVEQLLGTPTGGKIRERCLVEGESLHVPHLLDLEVAQVLRRYAQQRLLPKTRLDQVWEDFFDFPLTRYPHTPLLSRAWDLRNNLTMYDAIYVALAEGLDAPLMTCDARLASAHGHSATVILI